MILAYRATYKRVIPGQPRFLPVAPLPTLPRHQTKIMGEGRDREARRSDVTDAVSDSPTFEVPALTPFAEDPASARSRDGRGVEELSATK